MADKTKQQSQFKPKFRDIIEFETKKSLHFAIARDSFAAVKITCYEYNITLQELMNHFCSCVANKDEAVMNMIDKLAYDKRHKKLNTMSATDADSIYKVIKEINPIDNSENDD